MQKMLRFVNNGSDCYFNSVLQLLINTNSFKYLLSLNEDGHTIIEYFKLINSIKTLVNPRHIKTIISNYDQESNNLFGNNLQQDAHEAIIKIIDIIHNITKNDKCHYGPVKDPIAYEHWKNMGKMFGYSFITHFFTGQFKNILECVYCEHRTITYTNFNDISVDIYGNDIIDCITNFIKPEIVKGKCEKCESIQLAKLSTIYKFPKTLIVNIKRFEYNTYFRKIKTGLSINKTLKMQCSGIIYRYSLSSVVYHIGSNPNSGHYNIDVYSNNNWYKLDDDIVTKLYDIPEKSNDCYILAYNLEEII